MSTLLTQPRFDAFISYNHNAIDARVAACTQSLIEQLGKPWNVWRVARVFRDTQDMPHTNRLWSEIKSRIDDSGYFVLIASCKSVASPWVPAELCYWLTSIDLKEPGTSFRADRISVERLSRLMVVVAQDDWKWQEDARDFDWEVTNCLPKYLAGVFTEMPMVADLRAVLARQGAQTLDRSDQAFIDALAQTIAKIRGTKDVRELVDENLRQHRKELSIFRTLAAGLFLLLIVALVAGFVAKRQSWKSQHNLAMLAFEKGRDAIRRHRTSEAVLWYLEAKEQCPSGDTLAESTEKLTRHWLAQLGRTIVHDAPVLCVATSQDGEFVATGDAAGVFEIRQLRSLAPVGDPVECDARATAAAISPRNDTWVACHDWLSDSSIIGTVVQCRELSTNKVLGSTSVSGVGLRDAAYSPTGQWLIVRDTYDRVSVFDGRTLQPAPFAEFEVSLPERIVAVGFTSHDQELVVVRTAVLPDTQYSVVEVAHSTGIRSVATFDKEVLFAVVYNDINLTIVTGDGICHVIDLQESKTTCSFPFTAPPINRDACGSNGRLLGVATKHGIDIFDLEEAVATPLYDRAEALSHIPLSNAAERHANLTFSPDSFFLATSSDAAIRVYNASLGTLVSDSLDVDDRVEQLQFALQHGRCSLLVRPRQSPGVRVWDVPFLDSNHAPEENLESGNGVTSLALTLDDRRLLTADYTGSLTIRDSHTLGKFLALKPMPGLQSVRMSPDERRLFAVVKRVDEFAFLAIEHNLRAPIGDWNDEKDIETLEVHKDQELQSFEMTSDGGLLLFARDRHVELWERRHRSEPPAKEYERRATFSIKARDVSSHPRKPEFAVINDGRLDVVSLASQASRVSQPCGFSSLEYSPDGDQIALFDSGSDDSIAMRVVDANTLRTLVVIPADHGQFNTAAFSADGRTIVTGGRVGQIAIWDSRTGHLLMRPAYQLTRNPLGADGDYRPRVKSVLSNRDGRWLVAGTTRDDRYGTVMQIEAEWELRRWQIPWDGTPTAALRAAAELQSGTKLDLDNGRIVPLTRREWSDRATTVRLILGQ